MLSTHATGRPSILDQLDAFLPELRKANEDTERRREVDPNSVSVEHVEDDTQQHIEMNLSCGLFEAQPKDASAERSCDDEDADDAHPTESALRLPTAQTAAVAAAKRAGRILISEAASEDDANGDMTAEAAADAKAVAEPAAESGHDANPFGSLGKRTRASQ